MTPAACGYPPQAKSKIYGCASRTQGRRNCCCCGAWGHFRTDGAAEFAQHLKSIGASPKHSFGVGQVLSEFVQFCFGQVLRASALACMVIGGPLFSSLPIAHSLRPDARIFMHNATLLRRTIFESQTTRNRQNSRPIAFASAVTAVGLIALSSGDSCGKRTQLWLLLLAREVQRQKQEETCPTFPTCRCRPASSTGHTPTRRMERESGTHSRGIPPRQGGDLLGERGRGERVDGRDALRNGCTQSRQRFLHQLGDIPVQYQSTAPQGGSVKDGGTKQIVQSLSKQYTDKQGWEAAELAPRVAERRWLQHQTRVVAWHCNRRRREAWWNIPFGFVE